MVHCRGLSWDDIENWLRHVLAKEAVSVNMCVCVCVCGLLLLLFVVIIIIVNYVV